MTYDQLERSNYDGRPVSLYEFKLGTKTWRYTSAESDISFAGKIYTSIVITDEGIVQSGEASDDEFKVVMQRNTDFNNLFIGTPPSESIFVTMRRMNRGDSDAPVFWAGTLKSNKLTKRLEREIICRPLTSSLRRAGLRLSWGRNCPHALYDLNCRVDPGDFAVASTVGSIDGFLVGIGGLNNYDNHYFTGGYIKFVRLEGVTDRIAIESHVGNILSLLNTPDHLVIGQVVTAYPGCDRVTSTCSGKFNNLANYGGIPQLPTKSPFDGDPVF